MVPSYRNTSARKTGPQPRPIWETRVHVPNNNSILIKDMEWDGQEFAFKPYLKGGALEYTVDLSTVECGCVAGVYAVKLDNEGCGEDFVTNDDPVCPSIDIMQANPYGFNTAVHPCSNGNCDAQSQCEYNMREQGKEQYGEGAYGPGGSLVNTDRAFTVKTEFIADTGYTALWAIRTRVTQDGNEIVLQADCSDYISMLSDPVEGNMGYVLSAWDNRTGDNADFECEGHCQTPAASCDNAVNSISNFKFEQYGYTEEKWEDDTVDPVDPIDPTPAENEF